MGGMEDLGGVGGGETIYYNIKYIIRKKLIFD